MNNYLFFLGNHPKISTEEIKSLLRFLKINVTYKSLTREILIVNTESELNCKDIIKKLGGTIKIAILAYEGEYISPDKMFDIFKDDEKIRVGISSFEEKIDKDQISRYLTKLKDMALSKGKKLNYILPKNKNRLSSAQVFHKIFPKGYEINILRDADRYIFAKTLTVQNVDLFSKLDYGVPYNQKKSGMLPPKLAQMMINLSLDAKKKKPIMYDPFCGTGRVLIQSLFLGMSDIYGSDINKDAIEKTKGNIDWLVDNFRIDIDNNWKDKYVFVHDATEENNIIKEKINYIVTEPDLGKPHKRMPSEKEINDEFVRLEKLYIESFKSFRKILDEGSRLVVVFPIVGRNKLFDNLVDKLEALGYHMKRNFIYARDYQIVKRHIVVFNFLSK